MKCSQRESEKIRECLEWKLDWEWELGWEWKLGREWEYQERGNIRPHRHD